MVAPHSLALHGNLAGEWGRRLPLGLLAATVLMLLLVNAFWRTPDNAGTNGPLAAFVPAYLLPVALGAQMLTALTAGTGVLVTAGFSFNETFLYWFPNFAVAYILLGFILLLHLVGERWVRQAQILFTATAAAGLLLLAAIALLGSGNTVSAGEVVSIPSTRGWAAILLLFVGVELALLHPQVGANAGETRRLMSLGVVSAALLFALWGWAAVGLVPLSRLTDTTIAPVLVARTAWGQYGRYAMSIITIAGTLAAVNALFAVVAATTSRLQLHLGSGGQILPQAAVPMLLGILIAAALALGFAGTERLDVALEAGLVLWLFYYGFLLMSRRAGSRPYQPATAVATAVASAVAGALILAAAGLLAFVHPDRSFLIASMLAGLAAAALAAGSFWGWARTFNNRSLK